MDLLARLDAHDQIRLLASRYAVAVDRRDLDALVALSCPTSRSDATRSGGRPCERHSTLRFERSG